MAKERLARHEETVSPWKKHLLSLGLGALGVAGMQAFDKKRESLNRAEIPAYHQMIYLGLKQGRAPAGTVDLQTAKGLRTRLKQNRWRDRGHSGWLDITFNQWDRSAGAGYAAEIVIEKFSTSFMPLEEISIRHDFSGNMLISNPENHTFVGLAELPSWQLSRTASILRKASVRINRAIDNDVLYVLASTQPFMTPSKTL